MNRPFWPLAMAVAGSLAACGGAEPGPPPEAARPEVTIPKVALLVGPTDGREELAEIARGLAIEVAHWLSYVPGVAVRADVASCAETGCDPGGTAMRLDVDHLVRMNAEARGDGWLVRYRLDPLEGDLLVSDSLETRAEGLPALARGIALAILRGLHASGGAGPASGAATLPPPDAYVAFLRLLGGEASGGDGETRLVARANALQGIVAGMPDYPPAVMELGSTYLDIAGLVEDAVPNYELAGRYLSRAVELDPAFPPAREKLASYHTKLGRSEEAMALLVEGVARHPNRAGFHDAMGYLLRYAGFMRESIASYRRAQELDASLENLVGTQDQITKSYIYLGDYGAALASHERVEALLDSLGEAPSEKEHFYKGVILLLGGDRQAAIESFRAGRAVDPGTIWSLFGEGYEGIATGDHDRVADVLARLEARDVVDGERHYRLVHLAAFLDEPERALRHLGIAIEGGFFNAPYMESDPLTAGLRTVRGFEELLAKAGARHEAFPRPGA